MTVVSGASGSGGGVVVLNVQPNTGGSRSGTATIAGQTFSVTEGGGACGALDVTSEVTVYLGGFTPEPYAFTIYDQTVRLTNTSGIPIPGPVYLVTLGEPSHNPPGQNSSLVYVEPLTTCFSAQGDYLVPTAAVPAGTNWLPGQVVSGTLEWVVDTPFPGYPYPYTVKVLSGLPSH
jgi:hypothetical protein